LQLKDKYGAEVTVLSMGPAQAAEALRECYAMGADNMVLVSDRAFGGADTLATSYTLAAAIRSLGEFDIIFCGKQAIDGDTAQVGPEIAEHLGIAQVTYVAGIEIKDDCVEIKKEQEDCYERIQVKMPVLLTAVKSLNEPRYPNVMKKMKANRMEVKTLTADDLPELDRSRLGLKGSPTKVKRTFVPKVREGGMIIEGEDAKEQVTGLLNKMAEAKITF
jgi:electron transfer flavoprotein beta subunit